jgi:hypothetical protein
MQISDLDRAAQLRDELYEARSTLKFLRDGGMSGRNWTVTINEADFFPEDVSRVGPHWAELENEVRSALEKFWNAELRRVESDLKHLGLQLDLK